MCGEWQMFNLTSSLMMAEELASYRERVSNRLEGDSDGEVAEGSDDSRIGNSRWCSCGHCIAMPMVMNRFVAMNSQKQGTRQGRMRV